MRVVGGEKGNPQIILGYRLDFLESCLSNNLDFKPIFFKVSKNASETKILPAQSDNSRTDSLAVSSEPHQTNFRDRPKFLTRGALVGESILSKKSVLFSAITVFYITPYLPNLG